MTLSRSSLEGSRRAADHRVDLVRRDRLLGRNTEGTLAVWAAESARSSGMSSRWWRSSRSRNGSARLRRQSSEALCSGMLGLEAALGRVAGDDAVAEPLPFLEGLELGDDRRVGTQAVLDGVAAGAALPRGFLVQRLWPMLICLAAAHRELSMAECHRLKFVWQFWGSGLRKNSGIRLR